MQKERCREILQIVLARKEKQEKILIRLIEIWKSENPALLVQFFPEILLSIDLPFQILQKMMVHFCDALIRIGWIEFAEAIIDECPALKLAPFLDFIEKSQSVQNDEFTSDLPV